jgi:protein gp37
VGLTNIEWARWTFNVAWGCVPASAGCDNCYAERLSARWGFDAWGVGAARRTFGEAYWREPLKWNARAAAVGVRERVFCSSMTDVFLNDSTIEAEREKLWPLIAATPNLDWLLLTKHPERIRHNLPADWGMGYANVWLGTTVENEDVSWRVDELRKTRAALRFLSVEPMIGPVDRVELADIDWVICGGESGPNARPAETSWLRGVRDRCVDLQIAFFLKQLGGVRDKRGGEDALLDGRRWCEVPVVSERVIALCAGETS